MTFSVRYYPSLCLEGLRKTTQSSDRITGLRPHILTKEPPNIKQDYQLLYSTVRLAVA